jgi:putative serine protease PepD
VLAAAVLGAAAALGGIALTTAPPSAATAPAQALRVDRAQDANVDAAAQKASPSVVTVAVSSPGSSGTGSGVVLDGNGHILTNTHVVTLDGTAAHPTVQVQAPDGDVYPATVVGTDPLSDLAVIQVKATGAHLAPIAFGDPSAVNVGDTVAAIGAPLGLEGTVTSGIVSALDRTISVASSAAPPGGDQQQGGGAPGFQFAPPNGSPLQSRPARGTVSFHVIQTDAPINPGNSGGALVDDQGRLIGINVAIASTGTASAGAPQSGSIGIGFSIPADYARRIAGEIISHGAAAHALLGVTVRPASPPGAPGSPPGAPGSPFPDGAQVVQVAPGSPAQTAGIRAGDVITRFGDYPIHTPQGLTAAVHEQPPGATATISLTRAGRPATVHATLASAP